MNKPVNADKLQTTDSLRSLLTGMGNPEVDKAAGVQFVNRFLEDDQLSAGYRNSWLIQKIVDTPAHDALRKWRDWQAEQEQITAIEKLEKKLGVRDKILECKVQARLWGGAAIFMGVRGQEQDLTEPLDVERIGKDDLSYLTVVNRRELSTNELVQDPTSELYGKPSSYQFNNASTSLDVHPSRLVLQIGKKFPDVWNTMGAHKGWGDSIVQNVYAATVNADSICANIASLVFEANVDVFKVPSMMEHLGHESYRKKLIERFTLANIGKSITRALMVDSEEEYDRRTINFTALPDLLQQFLLVVSGASHIPMTRLLGQSPSGLSSTGEHDMKNYYDHVSSIQQLEIEPAISTLDEILIRSALGNRPDEIHYNWTPLEQMSEKEQAEIGKMNAETADIISRTGLFSPEEMREIVGNQMVENGFYPGLGDLLKENGFDLPEFNLERESSELGVEALRQAASSGGEGEEFGDAAPRTLYMRRDVLNGAQILKHYRDQGLSGLYDASSLHVTIVYSKKPIDWMKFGEPWEARLEVPEGGPRIMEKFGETGDVLVLQFASRELQYRHHQAMDLGAQFDFDEYQPHISIMLNAEEVDLSEVKPWQGAIVLGPEIYEEIKTDDWRKLVKTS